MLNREITRRKFATGVNYEYVTTVTDLYKKTFPKSIIEKKTIVSIVIYDTPEVFESEDRSLSYKCVLLSLSNGNPKYVSYRHISEEEFNTVWKGLGYECLMILLNYLLENKEITKDDVIQVLADSKFSENQKKLIEYYEKIGFSKIIPTKLSIMFSTIGNLLRL